MISSPRLPRRPLASSISKLPSAAAVCAILTLATASAASAATYYWDADGTAAGNDAITGFGLGGAGTWTVPTSASPTTVFFDPATTQNIVWPNTNPNSDTAAFVGTGGAVTLGSPVFANSLQFGANGYSIVNGGTAANTLTLNGASPTITVTNAGDSALISAVIAGNQGLIKTGAGTLQLGSTANTFTGDVQIQGGTLSFTGSGNADQLAFGAGSKLITLSNNATLALVGSTDSDPNVASGKGFVISSTGGTFNIASSRTLFLNDGLSNGSAQNQLQGTGTLTKTGPGALIVGRDYTSTFSGDVNVNLGRVDIAATGGFGNAGTITVDATAGATRLNIGSTSTTAVVITNNVVLQNGAVLSTQGANQNLQNDKSITIGNGTSRVRVDDGAAGTISATNRTFVLNGALNGAAGTTLEVTGPTGATRGVFAISNTASNFAGTLVIDKNVSVENFARFNGTTATVTGKTLGTATIKFAAVSGGSGSTTDGQLDLRDNGTGSNQVFNYGNNVDMTSTGGTIVVGTATGGTPVSTGGRFVLGTLSLGAGNTLTANTTNSYSLEFGGVTTLGGDATFTNAADLTLTGGITGGSNLTKNGAGRLTVGAPAGATYTGNTTINAGGVVYGSDTAIGGTGASVTVASGAYIGANFAATQSNLINRVVQNANTSVIALGADTSANLDLTGFSAARLGAVGTTTYTGTLTPNGTGAYLLGGGGGTLILSNANAITGSRGLDVGTSGTPAGVVALDSTNDFTGAITLSGGQLLRPASNGSLGNTANTITATGGGIQLKAGAGFDIFSSRTITFGTGGFILDTNGNDLTPGVAIGNSGAGGFTKTGAGKLTLNQASTYTGKTLLSGGTLSISADNQLGAATTATDQLQISNNATLEVTGSFTIPAARGVTLVANGGGATFDVTGSNTLTIASIIASTNGQLTKNGTGTLLITADPNNTGGFTINSGVMALQHGGSTDGNFVINSGGTLQVLTANDLGDNFNVTANTGGVFDLRANDQIAQLLGSGTVTNGSAATTTLTVSSATNATFAGTMQNGVSALAFTKSGANVTTLTGTNTYTGTTTINNGTLVVSGPAGAINGTTTVNVGDNNGGGETLIMGAVSDVVSGTLNRLADTANLTLSGSSSGGFTYNGPAAGSGGNVETIGTLTASAGRNTFTLVPGAGNEVQFTSGTLARNTNGTLLIRGDNLGGTGTGSTRLVVTNLTGLVGAGGADNTTAKSILPFAVGDNSSTGGGSGFLTNDSSNGLRLLAASEYDSAIAGSGTQRNVSVAGGEAVTSSTAINSLRVTGGTTTLNAGSRVAVGSGAVLFTNSGTVSGGALDFGAAEGILTAAGNGTTVGTITSRIGSLAGLTISATGTGANVIELGGDNDVAGTVTVNAGTLRLLSSTALNDNIPVTLIPRIGGTVQLNGNDLTVRNLQVGGGGGSIQNGGATAATLTGYLTAAQTVNTALNNGATGALNLVVSGNTLSLVATNGYTGTTEVRNGTIALSGNGTGTIAATTGITLSNSTLRLTNNNTTNSTNRITDTAPITLNTGTIDFDNNASALAFSETAGALTLNSGANGIIVDKGASTTNTSTLTFASLARSAGATLNLSSQNANTAIFDLGTAATSRLVFTTAPTLDDGIVGGWATIDSSATAKEFVKYSTTGTISATALVAADYATTLTSGANATQNVKLTASPAALTAATQINSLNLAQASATALDLGTNTLRVESGGIIASGAFNASITNGVLTAGTGTNGGELFIHTVSPAANPTTVSAVIANNGTGVVSLVKAGSGVLDLQGATNTYTGSTYVNGGTLRLNSDAALGAAPATAGAAQLTLSSSSVLDVTSTMALDPNRGITVGAGSNIISIAAGTAGNGKTLTFNGSITGLGTAEGSLQFRSNTTATNVDPGKISATLSSAMNLSGALVVDAGSISLGGTANTVGRSLNIGTNGVATLAYTGANNSLTVGKGITDTLNVGVGVGDIINNQGTLNLAGLGRFTANVDAFQLGIATVGHTGRGVVTLANNNDIVAGTAVTVGFSNDSGNNGVTSSLTFGSGINNVTTKTFTVGGNKSVGTATVAAGGTLNLSGFGANTLDLLIGTYGATGVVNGSSTPSTFDTSAGTLNASLNRLAVGEKTGGSGGGTYGVFTMGAGANNVVANTVTIGNVTGSSAANTTTTGGTVNIGGGAMTVNGDVSIGLWSNNATGTPLSTGTLNITGGTVTVGGNVTTSNTASATSTVVLNGGTLDLTAGNINVDTFTAQSGTLKNVAQMFSGDGATAAALTKTGVGVLAIEGANTYTGGTNVNAGTLMVNGSIEGSVSVAGTATLSGGGSIGGPVNVASLGTLSPGNGIGKLDVTGGITLADNSTLRIELNGLTPVTGYDQLNTLSGAGSVSLGTNVTLSLSLGFTPNVSSDSFYYILNRSDAGSYGNTFAGLGEGAKIDLGNGIVGTLTYQANWTGNAATSSFTGGNDVAIAVPEPGTVATLISGVGALVGLGRFRRRFARA